MPVTLLCAGSNCARAGIDARAKKVRELTNMGESKAGVLIEGGVFFALAGKMERDGPEDLRGTRARWATKRRCT